MSLMTSGLAKALFVLLFTLAHQMPLSTYLSSWVMLVGLVGGMLMLGVFVLVVVMRRQSSVAPEEENEVDEPMCPSSERPVMASFRAWCRSAHVPRATRQTTAGRALCSGDDFYIDILAKDTPSCHA